LLDFFVGFASLAMTDQKLVTSERSEAIQGGSTDDPP
jgi:hypothetical protein